VQRDRRAHIFTGAFFLAIIMAPGLIQTISELQSREQPRAFDVFRAPPTAANLHAYERGIESTSLVMNQLRPWTQYLEWRFLGDAGEEVVPGRDGWLFYRPGVRYVIEREPRVPESNATGPIPAIRSFRDQLQARGIRLLVVPVPGKESAYPDMLAKRAENAGVVVCESTRRLLDELDNIGIEHVDLFDEFRRARQEDQSHSGPLYLAQDSHWSPEGARLAATAVARQVLDGGTVKRGDLTYTLRPVTVQRHGDLVEMLQAPQVKRVLEPETLKCLQVIQPGTGVLYRDLPESEILVLGDSFLRIYEQDDPGSAGFIAHLALELGQPLAAIVSDGGASTLVRQALARRPALLSNKRLVIWEFAERDIRFGTEGWQVVPLIRAEPAPR
jgi:hypothetical protein